MKILFIAPTSAAALAESVDALIAALRRRGHAVTCVIPDASDVSQAVQVKAIRQAMRGTHFDVAHFAGIANASLAYTVGALPAVLDLAYSRSYLAVQQLAQQPITKRTQAALTLARWRRSEAALATQFERVVVAGQREAWVLRLLAESQGLTLHAQVVPAGVTVPPPALPVVRQSATLFFSGNPQETCDRAALQILLNQIMPLVWREHAEVQLIVASDVDWPQQSDSDPRVQWLAGRTERLAAQQQATLAIAPHALSAGLPYGLLDAMIAGLPLLARSAAVAHLNLHDGEHVVLADTPARLARSILALLDDPRWRGQIGRAGREYATLYHSWDLVAADFEQVYAAAAGASIADWRLELGMHRPNYWRGGE
jgi:glycosyltransferase involved in cell wall biosynthesis